MAEDLASIVTLKEFKPGDFLANQDAEDTDMFFLLTGKLENFPRALPLAMLREAFGQKGACRGGCGWLGWGVGMLWVRDLKPALQASGVTF
jgi:hypothetical protein